ncbi:hypothetical protein N9X32_07780, partial [Pseudomonadales bacterium]|nr:hypothetical protein [Pseudomonadales bacterium]
MTITEITSEMLAVLRTAIRSTAAGCKRFLKKTFAVNETIQNVAFGLLAMAILGATSHTTSASVSVSDNLCTTNHCWTVTNQDGTVLWVGITLNTTYIDVPVDSGSDSVIDGWERVSIYLEYDGQEYLISNHDGAAFQMDQAPSNLDKFNLAMQSGSIRVKAGPNFTLTELFTRYQGARVRLGFAAYQGYSVDDVNLEFNQVTVKRPIDGTGNRDEGFCAELFAGDVVDLNDGVPDEEGQGFSVVTENPITLPDNSLLYGQGFFGRALFCANTPLLTATAPIWVIDGRGGKRFMGNVELSIVEERVSGGSVNYSNKTSNNADDNDGDGIENNQDAFPNDPAASVDTDGDGLPDYWNAGKTASDSSSSPQLSLDNDDDNDQVSDSEDAYPYDPSRSILDGRVLPDCGNSYCWTSSREQQFGEIQYLYSVGQEAADFEFSHSEYVLDQQWGGGSSGFTFEFFDGAQFREVRVADGKIPDAVYADLRDVFKNSGGAVRLRYAGQADLAWLALQFNSNISGQRSISIFLQHDEGIRVEDISQLKRTVRMNRPIEGTGVSAWNTTDNCAGFSLEPLGIPAIRNIDFGLQFNPSRELPASVLTGGELVNFFTRQESVICSHHLPGTYDLTVEIIDGAGGKKIFPVQVEVLEEKLSGGAATWLNPITDPTKCENAYCLEVLSEPQYFFTLTEQLTAFPFERSFVLEGRNSGAGDFGFRLETDEGVVNIDIQGSMTEAQRATFAAELDGVPYHFFKTGQSSDASQQSWLAFTSANEAFSFQLHDDLGARVENLRQLTTYLRVNPPKEGTGSWSGGSDQDECATFNAEGFAVNGLNNFYVALETSFPMSAYANPLGPPYDGNDLYFCEDSPAGVYESSVAIIDGRGGKISWPLTIEVLAQKVDGGAIKWYLNKAAAGITSAAPDSDEDGIADDSDAFPDDLAASVDTDGDGQPDDWNEGESAADSTSDPALVLDDDDDNDDIPDYLDEFPLVASTDPLDRLIDPNGDYDGDGVPNASDHFPQDPSESMDLDFDGLGNNADDDDDGDGVLDEDDAFRFNPFETVDSDGDG